MYKFDFSKKKLFIENIFVFIKLMIVNKIGTTISKIFESNSVLEETILNHLIVKCFAQNTLALPGMKGLGKIK